MYILLNTELVEEEKLLDGVYVICSNLPELSPEDLISGYRGRIKIERAFMEMKQFLEIRHVFICVLAYLLNVFLEYKIRIVSGLDLTSENICEILGDSRIDEVEIKKY